ncbi:MAG: methyltransferase domain-containing protein [Elusimicrobiota bacterium]
MLDKEIIKKNFSKYAGYYDKYCLVQNHSAEVLISKIKRNRSAFSRRMNYSAGGKILDIGCGTGNYTRLLREKFPDANIKAIDISYDMIEIAKNKLTRSVTLNLIQGLRNTETMLKRVQHDTKDTFSTDTKTEFVVADAEDEEFDEKFDMITSNASFQWFLSLEKSLTKYKKLLGNNGVILFSTFGPKTFYELNASLKELFGRDTSLTSCGFIEKENLSEILEGQFRNVFVEEEIFQEEHSSLLQLLNKIRYTGTRGDGISANSFWTPKKIKDLEKIYKKKFNNLTASYQIFYCQGQGSGRVSRPD